MLTPLFRVASFVTRTNWGDTKFLCTRGATWGNATSTSQIKEFGARFRLEEALRRLTRVADHGRDPNPGNPGAGHANTVDVSKCFLDLGHGGEVGGVVTRKAAEPALHEDLLS